MPAEVRDAALSVDQAHAAIAAALPRIVQSEFVPLARCCGRVLAADLVAAIDLPSQDNAAMDGWALCGADLGAGGFDIVGASYAGHPFTGRIDAGQCVRITTGAVIPEGADTVVMQEQATAEDKRLTIQPGQPVQRAGQHVRKAGEDLARGRTALRSGTLLRPAHVALAAALGCASLEVVRRLRVAVFSTGDELRQAGQPLTPGALYDSNRPLLLAMIERLGCEAVDLGAAPDDVAALQRTLECAADCDAVITSGGVAAGDRDHTRTLMAKLGEVRFCSIDMRPGRPMAFGQLRGKDGHACQFFALPGNPVASAVSFLVFVRPALLRLQGCTEDPLPVLQARTRTALAKKPGRSEFLRGRLEHDAGGVHVRAAASQGSAMLAELCAADCLIRLGHYQGDIQQGEWVDVLPLGGLL